MEAAGASSSATPAPSAGGVPPRSDGGAPAGSAKKRSRRSLVSTREPLPRTSMEAQTIMSARGPGDGGGTTPTGRGIPVHTENRFLQKHQHHLGGRRPARARSLDPPARFSKT